MRLTPEIFERSFYYIGPGYDIEPLLRFTHLTDTFLYANLYLEKERVLKWYRHAFRHREDFEVLEEKVIDNFDDTRYFQLNPGYISHLTAPDFISGIELREYQGAFSHAAELPQWAIIFRLRRKSLNREITMIYFTGEGLASYIALSQNGRYSPRVLCTIETKVLEHPDSMMNAFFRKKDRERPLLWVRGFQPYVDKPLGENNTLNREGIFSIVGMDINNSWKCGWSWYGQKLQDHHCKGFITPETKARYSTGAFRPEFSDGNQTFIPDGLENYLGSIGEHDVVVVSGNLARKFSLNNRKVIIWDHFTNNTLWWGTDNAAKQITGLREVLRSQQIPEGSMLHIVPFCLEDEGVLFFESIKELPYRTVTYLKNPMDFVDLKFLP